MWGVVWTALLVGLTLFFYTIVGYHTVLIFLGLRMTRGGPALRPRPERLPFDGYM